MKMESVKWTCDGVRASRAGNGVAISMSRFQEVEGTDCIGDVKKIDSRGAQIFILGVYFFTHEIIICS